MPLLSRRAVEFVGNGSSKRVFAKLSVASRSRSEPRKKFTFSAFPPATSSTLKSALASWFRTFAVYHLCRSRPLRSGSGPDSDTTLSRSPPRCYHDHKSRSRRV